MEAIDIDSLIEKTSAARDAAWAKFGELDSNVLTHLLNPSLMGGPRWPAMRQAFRVVRRDGATLLASDGLADPFDDEAPPSRNGFGLELSAWTTDPLPEIPASWLWDIVWNMSQFAAKHGGLGELLDEMGALTTELYDVRIPAEKRDDFVNAQERVGVLLWPAAAPLPARVDGPLSPIRLVNVKLLTLKELDYVVETGPDARGVLAERFSKLADPQASSLTRASVI